MFGNRSGMTDMATIAELIDAGVAFKAEDAVAIVQQLIHNPVALPPEPPFGPPSIDNVRLHLDGRVTCAQSEVTPAVSEIGILLQALLPPHAPEVPSTLRSVIARALLDVDAPPFDSIHELSRELERFERDDRRDVVRRLIDRAAAHANVAVVRPFERRRMAASASDLRRHLREADERAYAQHVKLHAVIVPARRKPRQRTWSVAGVMAASILAAIGIGEAIHLRQDGPAPVAAVRPAAMPRTPAPAASIAAARDIEIPPSAAPRRETRPVVQAAHPRRVLKKEPVRTGAGRSRERRAQAGVLDKLRLQWLKNVFTSRSN